MSRTKLAVGFFSSILCLFLAAGDASAIDKKAFRFRYRESKFAWLHSNRLKEIGAVLLLRGGGVPGRSNRRIVELNISRYVSFDVHESQTTARGPYDIELALDSLLVITKLKFHRDSIELWTRTIDPFLVANGYRLLADEFTYYGTKFRFFFPEATLAADDLSPIYRSLDRWFTVFPNFAAAMDYLRRQTPRPIARRTNPAFSLAGGESIHWPTSDTMPGQNPRLVEFAGQKVTVTGKVYERSGSRALVIERIGPAPARK